MTFVTIIAATAMALLAILDLAGGEQRSPDSSNAPRSRRATGDLSTGASGPGTEQTTPAAMWRAES